MAGWAGFTDDDLRKLKQQTPPNAPPTSPSRRPGNLKKPRPALKDSMAATAGAEDLDPAQRLSKPKQKHVTFNGIDDVDRVKPTEADGGGQESRRQMEPEVKVQPEPPKADPHSEPEVIRELDETEAISSEVSKSMRFQQQQKLIEEANRQKKLLLAKTIEERKRAAKQEASKLTKIQAELNHLDNLLTADVSLLRNQIEVASIHFLEAQKRYEKAEKEFIEAKMHLYATSEQKELLTEHLYTIIHQNEVRKAKKLSELMNMLEMETSAEDLELTFPAIPPLTSFHSPSTIHDPSKHHPPPPPPPLHLPHPPQISPPPHCSRQHPMETVAPTSLLPVLPGGAAKVIAMRAGALVVMETGRRRSRVQAVAPQPWRRTATRWRRVLMTREATPLCQVALATRETTP